jgi:PASTA domain
VTYTVLLDEFLDLTGGSVSFPAVVGSIWVPEPSDGSSPGTPTFTGTGTNGPPPSVTFPAPTAPPGTNSSMLISEPLSALGLPPGDLYRLAEGPPADNPVHLNGFLDFASFSQDNLNNLTANFPALAFPVPGPLRTIIGIATLGLWIPTSVTVLTAALTLPATVGGGLTVTLTGTMTVQHWFWSSSDPFTFTAMVAVAPSGDPVDTSQIVRVTLSSPNLDITGGGILSGLAGLLADNSAPVVEAKVNQAIPAQVSNILAQQSPPMQMSPRAVVSVFKVVTGAGGVNVNVSLADIFGPATEPITAPPETTVPNIKGMSVDQARAELSGFHLRMIPVRVGKGTSISGQDPGAGETVPQGTAVVAYVGSGPMP